MIKSLNKKISKSRQSLQNPYAYLNDKGGFDALLCETDSLADIPLVISPQTIRDGSLGKGNRQKGTRFSYEEIEQITQKLQNIMWKIRSRIWSSDVPSEPINILDPLVALRFIGYQYDLSESLGQFSSAGKLIEVAGIIDSTSKQVRISRQFPPNIRNFTAAHELGHALLHDAKGLHHRDRPLDGSTIGSSREVIEIEADKFATYFLMPRKLVKSTFEKIYGTNCFSLNEETIFALSLGNSIDLKQKCKTLRDLSKILASAEHYNGLHFNSLASQFHVSTEAMAIRLEELELLEL